MVAGRGLGQWPIIPPPPARLLPTTLCSRSTVTRPTTPRAIGAAVCADGGEGIRIGGTVAAGGTERCAVPWGGATAASLLGVARTGIRTGAGRGGGGRNLHHLACAGLSGGSIRMKSGPQSLHDWSGHF